MKSPLLKSVRQGWPRDKMIAQWHKVLNDPTNSRYPLVRQIAEDALKNLHAEERIPGADDEVMAA